MVRQCQRMWVQARKVLLRSSKAYKRVADHKWRPARPYEPGQKVWLSTKDLPMHTELLKLAPRFIGPFPVSKVVNHSALRLRLPRSLQIHPTFHVSRVKPVRESPLVPTSRPPLRRGRRLQYLVDWEGYSPEERSWVSATEICDPTLIRKFHRLHPDQPSRTHGGVRRGGGTVMDSVGASCSS